MRWRHYTPPHMCITIWTAWKTFLSRHSDLSREFWTLICNISVSTYVKIEVSLGSNLQILFVAHIRDIDSFTEHLKSLQPTPENIPKRTKYLSRIQNALISAQELGDEKMQIVNQLQELIDTKTRQLDIDFKNLDYSDDIPQEPLPKLARSSSPTNSNQGGNGVRNDYGAYGLSTAHQRGSTPTSQNSERNSSNGERNFNGKRTRRPRNDMDNDSHSASENSSSVKNNGNNSGANGSLNVSGGAGNASGSSKNSKSGHSSGNGGGSSSKQKKKRKARQGREREESPPPDHIDPDEPTYCLCDQVSLN